MHSMLTRNRGKANSIPSLIPGYNPKPTDSKLQNFVTAIMTEFSVQIPSRSKGMLLAKNTVISDLQSLKDSLLVKLCINLEKNRSVSKSQIEDICINLNKELTDIIDCYTNPLSETAILIAKLKFQDICPIDPSDIGIGLELGLSFLQRYIRYRY
jgi:hypothetical protein